MSDAEEHQDPDDLGQGLDEGVVTSADAGTVSGVGAREALDEIDAEMDAEAEGGG
jgi:hypothetical protein